MVRWPILSSAVGLSIALATAGASAAQCPPGDTSALNLVWDRLDPNGLPLGPRWCHQDTHRPSTPDAPYPVVDPVDACGGFPTDDPGGVPMGRPRCVDRSLVSSDVPRGLHAMICGLEWFHDGRTHVTRGHINWLPVTFEGRLSFLDKSGEVGDNDYNFELETFVPEGTSGASVPRQSALTRYNRVNGTHRTLHVEMKGRETVSHMTDPWWVAFRNAVEGPDKDSVKAHRLIAARPAIVTGLFGLDAEHKGHSELHPVYAMAVQTSCSEAPDANGDYADDWALFVRNSGNEGFCSSWTDQHRLDLADNVFTFRLPAPGIRSASHSEHLLANVGGIVGPAIVTGPDAVLVSFQWPASAAVGPVRVHGTLRVKWKASGGPRVCPKAVATAESVEAGTTEDGNPEAFVESLYAAAAPETRHELLGLFRKTPGSDARLDETTLVPGTIAPPTVGATGICPGNAPGCPDGLKAAVADRIAKPTGGEALAVAQTEEEKERIGLCQAAERALEQNRFRGQDLDRLRALVSYCQGQ